DPALCYAMVPVDTRGHPRAVPEYTLDTQTSGAGSIYPRVETRPKPTWALAKEWSDQVAALRGSDGPVLHVLMLAECIPKLYAPDTMSERETQLWAGRAPTPDCNIMASNVGRSHLVSSYGDGDLTLPDGAFMFPFSPCPPGSNGSIIHCYTVGDKLVWGWNCCDHVDKDTRDRCFDEICRVMRCDM
ncbi:hypothetical protein KIPB_008427, partial [Kipferlia bialata]